jgi:hypothetical protein
MSAVALAIGLFAAPQLFAESRSELLVCRDGHVTSTRFGDEACRRHHGVDREATRRARREAEYRNRGVYAPNTQRGVYTGRYPNGANGTVYGGASRYPTTSTGTVYGGRYPTTTAPVYPGRYPNGTNGQVYGGAAHPVPNGPPGQMDDHDGPGRHGRGHAYGHDKQKHDGKGHDRDDDR